LKTHSAICCLKPR